MQELTLWYIIYKGSEIERSYLVKYIMRNYKDKQ